MHNDFVKNRCDNCNKRVCNEIQLDYLKRCKILAFWKAGYNRTEIAKEIGVHKSTVSRELNKNLTFVRTKLGSWQYKPDYASNSA